MTERWYFGEDPVSSVFAGDVRLYPTTPPQEQIQFPIIIDEKIYQEDDLHVFASNGKDVKWPSQATPIFVAVNGYESSDYDNPTVEPGDRIYALFDWDNSSQQPQDWYYDILQIGSIASSELTQPRQLANGAYAFTEMSANPKVLADLDTSNLTNMEGMFKNSEFDVDIANWNTTNVTNMDNMFNGAVEFSQDIHFWCVSNIPAKPVGFSDGTINWNEEKEPLWGTCVSLPDVFPIEIDGKTYSYKDAHIFVANDRAVQLAVASDADVKFVAVDGVPMDYVTQVKNKIFRNSTIHAIFNWNNPIPLRQNWFSDILQFGLNSETGKRNQLKDAFRAFYDMEANPAAIANLDLSNLTSMVDMFEDAKNFNQDISHWDVSNVTNMSELFKNASSFDSDISKWDTSNVNKMDFMFYNANAFNQDISDWDVSNVTNMEIMFGLAESFNSDISGWNTSKVKNMSGMFDSATSFNQNLSKWCVSKIAEKPDEFDISSGFAGQTARQPQWGTCPRKENVPNIDDILPGDYVTEDCHVFIGGKWGVDLAIDSRTNLIFVAVDGVEKDYREVQYKAFEDSTIHAIFDWNNNNWAEQDWYSDIPQFGSRSVGDEPPGYKNPPALPSGRIPNQLKNGERVFSSMQANPAPIATLDVSNLTSMESMFNDATYFNRDISGWDTSNVTNMNRVFSGASSFNQDLSQWCVSQFSEMPYSFDYGADNWEGGDATRPQWGTCPRPIQLPDGVLPEEYELEDCHIFVANENAVNLPIPNTATPVFVAVDGEKKNYRTQVKGETFPESIIHAIFDWDNSSSVNQNWYSDIIQFGLNSVTGQRNQLKNGKSAFNGMETNPAAISDLNVSNLTIMERMFETASSFNQNIANWDVSNVTDMSNMFKGAESFNQNISGWDTHKVVSMNNMFNNATSFNQDLHEWCVLEIVRKPLGFDQGTTLTWTKPKPVWGTCPREEGIINYTWPITIGGKTYEKEDAHIIVCNGKDVKFPIPVGTKPIFVGVNGKTRDPIIVTRTVEMEEIGEDGVTTATSQEIELASIDAIADGDIMEAIFDWDNANEANQDWYSEITQIGLNSVTGKRNQLKTGHYAFASMAANPAVITNLDISNLTDMEGMFYGATRFNKSIFWDTSNVTNMKLMFRSAKAFNSDLSKWNTSKVETMEYMFGQTSFNRDISGWNTSNVRDMSYMFQMNSYFTIPIGNWNTSKVEEMDGMFDRATKFNGDLSKWDTSKVTRMKVMFSKASSFNQDLSQWCVSNVTNNTGFDDGATAWTKPKPVWGTCPRGEDGS